MPVRARFPARRAARTSHPKSRSPSNFLHTLRPEFTRMIRVLVADDFPLVRDALAAALGRHERIEVVGVASDGIETLERAHELRPDVVVLDLRMPGMSGLVALTRLSSELPGTRVLLLTACEEPETVIDAVSAGAAGFVTKRIRGTDLAEAVCSVHRGAPVISASLTAPLVAGLRREGGARAGGSTGNLTTNELNILRLVADGRTDKQISQTLYISPRTVQSHLAQIRTKTGVRRRTQLARRATEHLVTQRRARAAPRPAESGRADAGPSRESRTTPPGAAGDRRRGRRRTPS